MRWLVVVLVVAVSPAVAFAQDEMDPDSEVARRHFQRGVELYDQSDYKAAVVEFQVANDAYPRPQLDYNIARCFDRLGDWVEARNYYLRYLGGKGVLADADAVKKRVAELDERLRRAAPVVVVPAPLPPPPPSNALRISAIVLGVVAVGALGAGGGLYGSAAADFPARQAYCAALPRECVPSEWADLQGRANAAYALFAIGGAAAIADVVLWAVDVKRRRHIEVRPLVAGVRF